VQAPNPWEGVTREACSRAAGPSTVAPKDAARVFGYYYVWLAPIEDALDTKASRTQTNPLGYAAMLLEAGLVHQWASADGVQVSKLQQALSLLTALAADTKTQKSGVRVLEYPRRQVQWRAGKILYESCLWCICAVISTLCMS
jgi:hypothetical protein